MMVTSMDVDPCLNFKCKNVIIPECFFTNGGFYVVTSDLGVAILCYKYQIEYWIHDILMVCIINYSMIHFTHY